MLVQHLKLNTLALRAESISDDHKHLLINSSTISLKISSASKMDSASDRNFVKELRTGESARLLSLDGGGVKGISSLVILQAIMEAVKEKEIKEKVNTSDEERLPINYFHLAAGTSTGGLIALMLFRLSMSTSDAIVAYQDMASKIFMPTLFGIPLHWAGPVGYWFGNGWLNLKATLLPARFSDKPLKAAIDDIVGKYGRSEDKALKGEAILLNQNAGRMWVVDSTSIPI